MKIIDACKEAGLKTPVWTAESNSVKLTFFSNTKLEGSTEEAIEGTVEGAIEGVVEGTVRVYQGYFQFVELSLTGCQLNRHTIIIPPSLLNIAQESNLRSRVRSTCQLVDDTSEFTRKLKGIENQVKELRNQFTKPLGKQYGSVILRNSREAFEQEVEKIQKELSVLQNEVKDELENEIDNSRSNLIEMLLPGVMSSPPKALTSQLIQKLTEETARKFIAHELNKRIPKPESLIGEMKLNCCYKDVTFEMLNDEGFINAIKEKYQYNDFAKLYLEQETIGQKIIE